MDRRSVDELLSTTRAVRRRLDLDEPVADELVRECIELAVQAPSGSNTEPWHWVVITDERLRAGIASLYRRSFHKAAASPHFASRLFSDDQSRSRVQKRVADSASYLAEQLHRVPVLVIPCIAGRPPTTVSGQSGFWGSILPAVWSFMLAARSRGLGTAFTTVHLEYEREAAELVGIPFADTTQAALIPVAHYLGDGFRPAPRQTLSKVVSWNGWSRSDTL